MAARKPAPCIGCKTLIDINQKALVIFLSCQTVGIQPRQKGESERIYLCSRCTARVAVNEPPSRTHPVEVAMYNMIVGVVGRDPAVMQAAWEYLNRSTQGVPALPEQEILPPSKRLQAVS